MTQKITFKFDSPPSFTFPPLLEDLIGYAWLVDNLQYTPKARTHLPEPRIDFNRIALEGARNFVIAINMDGIEILIHKNDIGKVQYRRLEVNRLTDFPLEVHKDGWLYGSQMFYAPGGHSYIEPTRQKFDSQHSHLIAADGRKRKYRTNAGPDKAVDIPQERHLISEAWFYFEGDSTEVSRLCKKYIRSIGKKGRSQGRGVVSGFEIENSSVDFHSHLLRPMPLSVLDEEDNYRYGRNGFQIQQRSWAAPAWLPENIDKCYVPFTELSKNAISYEAA